MGHFFGKKLGGPRLVRLFFLTFFRFRFFIQGRASHFGAATGEGKEEEKQGGNP
jgi:hypothetical protein